MEKNLLMSLARQLNLTSLEPEKEEFILTPEEVEVIVFNSVEKAKERKRWKLTDMGLNPFDVEDRIERTEWKSEIDFDSILERANSNKHYQIWQKEQREKEKEAEIKAIKDLKESWSAKKMFSHMKWASENIFGKQLIVNEDNKKLISALCFMISRDERFEKELGYSFNKGLMIRGVSGLGKTHLVRCLESNSLNPILCESMIDITSQVKIEGEYSLVWGNKKILYLDDVGTEEPTINHYGTKINWFKDFIERFYLKNNNYHKLIISTNINFSEMENRYGFRVRSRLKDMFNVIDVTGKDMRG